jgi:hypothetical protein
MKRDVFMNSGFWTASIMIFGAFSILLLTPSTLPAEGKGELAGSSRAVLLDKCRKASIGRPTRSLPVWTAEPRPLAIGKQMELSYWSEHTDLPGPGGGADEVATEIRSDKPPGGTSSKLVASASGEPTEPSSARVFRSVKFDTTIPDTYKSNVMDCSVGISGKYAFFTGDWFAARSTNGGKTWTYIDAYSDFPDFCCDQATIWDGTRDRLLWVRMGLPDTNATGNYENTFKLSVSGDGGASFWTYTVKPTEVDPNWTDLWWDRPRLQLGADYLYLTWNLFSKSTTWVRSVLLRLPLDDLAAGAPFTYEYYSDDGWFNFVPLQGASHSIYWASNWPAISPRNNRIAIWKWDEHAEEISSVIRTIHSWSFTNRGDAQCGSVDGNWVARSDQRLQTGARYEIHGTDTQEAGRKVLAWWWNVKAGGSFLYPYIEAAAFYEDTLTQLPGKEGRPLIWNSRTCFGFPGAAVNRRGDLGIVFHYGSGMDKNPSVAYAIADNFEKAPPGWSSHSVRRSLARPSDNKWGAYNRIRAFEPSRKVWVGASHFLPTTNGDCCSASAPLYFVFGRERDYNSWNRWQGK